MRVVAFAVLFAGSATTLAAPAPLPRSLSIEAMVGVPDGHEASSLASKIRSGWFLSSALRQGLRPNASRPSVDWMQTRLRVSGEGGGRSLRLTLVNCDPDEGRELMRAILIEYLCEVIPEKKSERQRLKGRHQEWIEQAKKIGKDLKARDLYIIHEYFLQLVEREKAERIVKQQPRTVRGKR